MAADRNAPGTARNKRRKNITLAGGWSVGKTESRTVGGCNRRIDVRRADGLNDGRIGYRPLYARTGGRSDEVTWDRSLSHSHTGSYDFWIVRLLRFGQGTTDRQCLLRSPIAVAYCDWSLVDSTRNRTMT